MTCCVPGCPEEAPHTRAFTIANDGWGEAEVTASFCCRHLDMLAGEVGDGNRLILDLAVVGVERERRG